MNKQIPTIGAAVVAVLIASSGGVQAQYQNKSPAEILREAQERQRAIDQAGRDLQRNLSKIIEEKQAQEARERQLRQEEQQARRQEEQAQRDRQAEEDRRRQAEAQTSDEPVSVSHRTRRPTQSFPAASLCTLNVRANADQGFLTELNEPFTPQY